MPTVRADAYGELVVLAASIEDAGIAELLNKPALVMLIEQGATVWMRLSVKGSLDPQLHRFENPSPNPEMTGGVFAPVSLREALKLETRGTKRGRLCRSECTVPTGVSGKEVQATSLNHAYRLLSERFEPHRVSKGGNVFLNTFVERPSRPWPSLEEVRVAAEGLAEAEVEKIVLASEPGEAAVAPIRRAELNRTAVAMFE